MRGQSLYPVVRPRNGWLVAPCRDGRFVPFRANKLPRELKRGESAAGLAYEIALVNLTLAQGDKRRGLDADVAAAQEAHDAAAARLREAFYSIADWAMASGQKARANA